MAARVDVWKPGAYAGGLFADLVQAQQSVAAILAGDRPFYTERLQRIAERAGVALAPTSDVARPIATI